MRPISLLEGQTSHHKSRLCELAGTPAKALTSTSVVCLRGSTAERTLGLA